MRIRYRLLWIEDNEDYVNDLRPILVEYMDSLGFELEIVHRIDGNDSSALPQNDFEYDLILVDYNLNEGGQGGTGDAVINLIRSDSVITEAIFYSSNTSLKLHEMLSGAQRISYHLGKTGLPNAIKKIIGLTIRKVQDVNNMRGLVIAEVIDLEMKMKAILQKFFATNNDSAKQRELIDKKVESITEALEKIKKYSPEKVLNFIEDHHTVDDHCKALLRLIKYSIDAIAATLPDARAQKLGLASMRAELEKMRDEVIRLRNIMAHVEEQNKAGKIILQSRDGKKIIEITTKRCIEIRQALRKHSVNLEKIAAHFFKQSAPTSV